MGTRNEPIAFALPDISDDDVAAVTRVLRSGWLTTGDECAALERDLAERTGTEVIAMSSCTAALETAFAWLSLPAGARVGVPTWTFVSSALAPLRSGAEIVLLDVDPCTLNLSPESLAAALEDGLEAVVPVHFGGVPVQRAIHDLCAERSVPIVEDAAHAFGATDHRGPIGGRDTVGAAFSFYCTKNLTSGEGGALATDNEELAEFARSFRLHGMSRDAWARYRPGQPSRYDVVSPGIKGNMPDVLAALARSQLERFDSMQARRRELVERYRARLRDVLIVPLDQDRGSADHLMVVLLPEGVSRDGVQQKLTAAAISTSIHFRPLHDFEWLRSNARLGPSGVDIAAGLAERALSLPLHTGLCTDDVDRVCDELAAAL